MKCCDQETVSDVSLCGVERGGSDAPKGNWIRFKGYPSVSGLLTACCGVVDGCSGEERRIADHLRRRKGFGVVLKGICGIVRKSIDL